MKYTIYTDGSCIGNPGPGGYAALIKSETKEWKIKGHLHYTTVNRTELLAVIRSLEEVRDNSYVAIYTDSKYVESAFNEGRILIWMANGWKRIKTGEDIENRDLWQQIIEITRSKNLTVKYKKVKAHSFNTMNNKADRIARKQATKYLP